MSFLLNDRCQLASCACVCGYLCAAGVVTCVQTCLSVPPLQVTLLHWGAVEGVSLHPSPSMAAFLQSSQLLHFLFYLGFWSSFGGHSPT